MAKDTKAAAVDAESRAMLELARKGKPKRFAMIYKGASVLALSVFKKGQPDAKARALKQAGFKGLVCTGVISGKGMDIRFELLASEGYEKEPVKDAQLRKFLKDEADLAAKPTFAIVEALSDADAEDDEAETQGEGAEPEVLDASTPEEDAGSGADVSGLVAALKQLTPKVQQAIKGSPAAKDELMELMRRAKGAIDAGDADGARQAMIIIGARVKALQGGAEGEEAPEGPAAPMKPVNLDEPDPRAGRAALRVWQDAKEEVDERLGVLITALRSSGDPDLERIADKGLAAITGKLQTGLRVSLMNLDAATGAQRAAALKKVTGQTAEFRAFLSSDAMVRLVDDNPFGVKVRLNKTISTALNEIDALVKA